MRRLVNKGDCPKCLLYIRLRHHIPLFLKIPIHPYHIRHFLHLLFFRELGYLIEGEIRYRDDVELEFVATLEGKTRATIRVIHFLYISE